MLRNRKWYSSAFAATLAMATAQALGQGAAPIEIESVPTLIGAGIGAAPDYKGSDDRKGVLVPFFKYSWDQTRYVQLAGNELSANLLGSQRFRLGPIAAFNAARDDEVDDEVVKNMNKLDSSIEIGVFGDMIWSEANNPRNRFLLGAALFRDNESEGMRTRISARWWHQVTPTIDLHLGAGLVWTDDDYTNHYYGVNPANVGTSGLPNFTAEGGTNEIYFTAGGLMHVNREWKGIAGLRIGKLQGDAKDSPIVKDRGDSTQTSLFVGAIYSWR